MTRLLTSSESTTESIVYPTGDGTPVAETYDHLYALLITLEVLRQYLLGQQATVLGNQFLYYSQGYPKLRVAPDVMVIFGVAPGGRDSYKIWEEGPVPSVIFEMTSAGTRTHDQEFKQILYQQMGVQEYWLFDPKGEWILEQLRGYQLQNDLYQPIPNNQSQVLQLQLQPEDKLISFYRLETGEKLLIPQETREQLDQAQQELEQERQRSEQERLRAEQERFRAEQEQLRAEQEQLRAEQEQLRAEQEQLRAEQEKERADREAQRAMEMEAMLERYREQFGDLS